MKILLGLLAVAVVVFVVDAEITRFDASVSRAVASFKDLCVPGEGEMAVIEKGQGKVQCTIHQQVGYGQARTKPSRTNVVSIGNLI